MTMDEGSRVCRLPPLPVSLPGGQLSGEGGARERSAHPALRSPSSPPRPPRPALRPTRFSTLSPFTVHACVVECKFTLSCYAPQASPPLSARKPLPP